ncbi:sigma 54-interacting transcriptional regulator [Lawsonibacter sp. LCP25S3_G6]|uniref:sigma 54-interacting transcriptional regulator n=1 Tax=unclassified Lawsonibacter TaxID=2617946 RepID=UPI003F9CF196
MNRQERIYAYIKEHVRDLVPPGESPGIDAATIAKALGIQRSDASADLNKLCRSGSLEKIGKKPVKFLLPRMAEEIRAQRLRYPVQAPEIPENKKPSMVSGTRGKKENPPKAFQSIIGVEGSIKAQIQLAKAAVSYPPNGLHTLIIGESGVGKSMLAEEMWRYAVETGAFGNSSKEPPFVLFSCADYADNPQLLLSQLFGHAKGSFSGATENKPGMVEKAEGGVLFLDEIHRLASTGQELLFTLLDKNKYRRLGETIERKSNVMIIAATTERPSEVLLNTFMRRIPVVIQMPNLAERPPNERLELVRHFLKLEANRLGIPIWLSEEALQLLISYECKENVGSLKNDIKLACAKSYLAYLSTAHQGGSRMLTIGIHDLPQKAYFALPNPEVLSKGQKKGLLLSLDEAEQESFPPRSDTSTMDLYDFVEERLDCYKSSSQSQGDLENAISLELERYYDQVIRTAPGQEGGTEQGGPNIVTPAIWKATKQLIDFASRSLNRTYPHRLGIALSMHLQQFIWRLKAGQLVYNPNLSYIRTQYPLEMDVVREILPELSRQLSVKIPEDEVGFLAMFLTQQQAPARYKRIGVVVAAYGRGVASGMAEVANRVFSTNHIQALDVPLEWTPESIFENLCQLVQRADQGTGVLVLGDIDSLPLMERDIQEKTGVRCRIIPGASNSLVLEAGKLVLISDADLDDAANIAADNYKDYTDFICRTMLKLDEEVPKQSPGEDLCQGDRDVVLTVCHSGIGAAARAREILLEHLPLTRTMDVIPVGVIGEVADVAKRLGPRLRLIIGSVNPGVENVPFLEMSKVLTNQGLSEIDLTLRGWTNRQVPSELSGRELTRKEVIALINSRIQTFAPSLDSDLLITQCGYILRKIESRICQTELSVTALTRVYLHIICMFERLATGEALPLSEATELVKNNRREDFNLLYSITTSVAYQLKIRMLESEVCYLLIILPERGETAS